MSNLIEKLIDIDNEINKCDQCFEYVEKISNISSIYFGTTPNLLIVGSAPEKDGWRESGIAWYNINNKLTYSGKKMQKLLEHFNIDLLQTCFVDAIKCYPIGKEYYNFCSHHCAKFLKSQIEVLNPKVVLLLGKCATKSALNINDFNKVVGSVVNEQETSFIPLYDPKSIYFKRNIKILSEFKDLLNFDIEEKNDSFALKRTI